MFFKKMGIENLRFKPAYNPYTEVIVSSRRVIDFTDTACVSLSRP